MPTDLNRDDVQRLMANGAQLIEVLPAEEYREAHLPGALNIPLKKLDRQSVKQLDPNRSVITYKRITISVNPTNHTTLLAVGERNV